MKLLLSRTRRLRLQSDSDNRIRRAKIFQVRLQQSKKQRHRVGRIGNLETMGVNRVLRQDQAILWGVGKSEPQGHFLKHEIEEAEATGELLEKSLQDKQQRLRGLNFVL